MPTPTTYTINNASDLLKTMYPKGWRITTYGKSKIYSWMRKDESWEGSSWQENPLYEDTYGANDFPSAQMVKGVPQHTTFNYTQQEMHHHVSISNRLIKNARTKKGAIADLFKTRFDSGMRGWGRLVARQIWGNGGGALGQVGALSTTTVTNDTITLLDIRDIVKFGVNQTLQGSAADGTSGALLPGEQNITKIIPATGQIIGAASWATQISGLTTNTYLFQYGTFGIALNGIQDHIPLASPSAGENHFGVDRSIYETRLAGHRYTADANKDPETVLFNGIAEMDNFGGEFEKVWIHNKKWSSIANSLHGKTTYENVETKSKSDTSFGFNSFRLMSPQGSMDICTDREIPYHYAFAVHSNAMLFASADAFPHFIKQSGDRLLVEGTSAGVEARMEGFGNVVVQNPVNAGWLQLSS